MQWMKKKGFKTEREMRIWCSSNYIQFWGEMAKTYADWFEPWAQTLEWEPPYARWFVGAKCNVAYNAVDRHAAGAKKDKVAYIFVPEPVDQPTQEITFGDLAKAVNKFANGLKSLGVAKGDRVSVYMPMIPETAITMLACAKIGAIHSVVFSGFSASGLNSRILDAESKVVVTTDGFFRRGKPLPIKPIVDEATSSTPSVQNMVVVKRVGIDVAMKTGRDVWYHELMAKQSDVCDTEKMDPEDRLFILYTSGTTGKPKGIEHVHGGYCVTPAQTLSWVFDIKDTDVWWCTADVGWITGHSYVVYGPLCLGATSILYEGSPDYPDFGRWFKLIQENKVSVFYTAPTAIRMFMKAGEQWPKKYDLSSLRLLGSVGEPINPDAWMWYREHFGGGKLQIMDTWWQTETGCFLVSPLPITPLKPGSPTFPLPGFNIDILDENANPVPPGSGGNIVSMTPWPSMLRAFFRDEARYKKEYWSTYWEIRPGTYLAGDKATEDNDGYIFIQGHIDNVLKVGGHRISNAEVESALVSHPKVADAAVIGKPDEVKGEALISFVQLKDGIRPSEDLKRELKTHINDAMGKQALPEEIHFIRDIPKTSSGRIPRRIIRAKALGQPIKDVDISMIANPRALDEIPSLTENYKEILPETEKRYAIYRFYREKIGDGPGEDVSAGPLQANKDYLLDVSIVNEKEKDQGVKSKSDRPPITEPEQSKDVDIYITLESEKFYLEENVSSLKLPPKGCSKNSARFKVKPLEKSVRGEELAWIRIRMFYEFNLIEVALLKVEVVGENDDKKESLLGLPLSIERVPERREMDYDADFQSIIPNTLHIDIDKVNDEVLLNFLYRDATENRIKFSKVPARVTQGDLSNILEDTRWILYLISLTSPPDPLQMKEAPHIFFRLFFDLARQGEKLWTLLFNLDSRGAMHAVGKWLRDHPLDLDSHVQVSLSQRASDFVIPWSLLYDKEITEKPNDIPDPKGFWGVRYCIEQRLPNQMIKNEPIEIEDLDKLKIAFIFCDVPRLDEEEKLMDSIEQYSRNRIAVSPRISDPEELKNLLGKEASDILYFYAHGNTAYKNDEMGQIKIDTSNIEKFKTLLPDVDEQTREECLRKFKEDSNDLAIYRKEPDWIRLKGGYVYLLRDLYHKIDSFNGSPLVVLNMCESAQINPSISHSFVHFFINRGAMSVLGTECKIGTSFAHPFAEQFLNNLLKGEEMGIALLHSRRHFERNPLGLAYTLYGSATVKMPPLIVGKESELHA